MLKVVALIFSFLLLLRTVTYADEQPDRLEMPHANEMLGMLSDTIHANGDVIFQAGNSMIYCDTAVWIRSEGRIILRHKVIIDDPEYRLLADSVNYDRVTKITVAVGPYVELWSHKDSLYAVGKYAYYDKKSRNFVMNQRPTVYLKYPDSSAMIEVVGDSINYDAEAKKATSIGNVIITSQNTSATAGRAVMNTQDNGLMLFEKPVVTRGKSVLSGDTISLTTLKNVLSRIDVVDSAKGELVEAVDSAKTIFDRSVLKGNHIVLDFVDGQLNVVTCTGQAYSWYYPSPRGKTEYYENSVSGDTIRFFFKTEKMTDVRVDGGAIGSYVSGKESVKDTVKTVKADTVNYNSSHISYSMADSVIVLTKAAHVTSGQVVLDAHKITFDTRKKLIEAYSASVNSDSARADSSFSAPLQPNTIPVALKDKTETILGDYLQYSTESQKGRIVQSKSKYETGFYYGKDVYRANRSIFYVDRGRYTTCDANEPHFHFYSKNMKLLEGDKLLAKPVVMYIGRLPILALPYYVFPLKRGRHSGFLPFSFGNIEKGDRYIRNVGYFWSPSDYWDLKGAIDYNERGRTITYSGEGRYKVLYLLDGGITAAYTKTTKYDAAHASESWTSSWTLGIRHSQTITPSLRLDADGQFQSSKDYYQYTSLDLKDRLNRIVRSHLGIQKVFGRSYAITATFNDDVDLDRQSRTDNIPTLTFSQITIHPFGSGTLKPDGTYDRKWYHEAIVTYTPSAVNYTRRDTLFPVHHDGYYRYRKYMPPDTVAFDRERNLGKVDPLLQPPPYGMILDSTYVLLETDSASMTTRKSFSRVDHSASLSFPLTIARYFTLNPSASYAENWIKIWPTDQSRSTHLDASRIYRTYLYSFSTSLSTHLYGTVYPKLFGLVGLRQVLTPTVSYSYVPRINRFPEVRAYVGSGAASLVEASSMNISLGQIYQAKVKRGETEQSFSLLSINSSLSYNFRKKDSAFSDIATTISSQAGQMVTFYGEMRHSVYRLGSRRATVFAPSLRDFSFNTSISLSGQTSIFDEVGTLNPTDSSHTLDSLPAVTSASSGAGWNISATYSFKESNIGVNYTKSSYAQFSVRFNLTPTTAVLYTQSYNFGGQGTVNNQLRIVKQLHCWVGTLYWVPVGSTRGYGFLLNVIAIPSIKIDNTASSIGSSYWGGVGR